MSGLTLKLFVVGDGAEVADLTRIIRRGCDHLVRNEYVLDVINVLSTPRLAEKHDVFATPTLVKIEPHPGRRVVGDLSDMKKVLAALGFLHGNKQSGVEFS